jgi:hypothetical protein
VILEAYNSQALQDAIDKFIERRKGCEHFEIIDIKYAMSLLQEGGIYSALIHYEVIG